MQTRFRLGLAALALAIGAAPLSSQHNIGTLILAHGADSNWNQQVLDVAQGVKTGGPVGVSFLMGPAAAQRRFQDEVARLRRDGATTIVVVPLFISSHSGHIDQLHFLVRRRSSLEEEMRHHLEMSGIEQLTDTAGVIVTAAIDDSPEAARIIAERVRALATDAPRQSVLLFGHGPNGAGDYALWMRDLRIIADSVRRSTGVHDVQVELVRDDAQPEVRAEAVRRARDLVRLQHEGTNKPVIVIPVLIATGTLSRSILARDLAGLPIAYAGDAILPDPTLARWVERRVREAVPLPGVAPIRKELNSTP